MITIARRVSIAILLIAGLTYLGDYASVAIPIPPKRQVFGSYEVQPNYIVPLKNDRQVEYDYDVPPVDETCVNSLFPHFGDRPCWYVARNLHPTIDEQP